MEGSRDHTYISKGNQDATTVQLLPVEAPSVSTIGRDTHECKYNDVSSWPTKAPDIIGWSQTPGRPKSNWRKAAPLLLDTVLALVPVLFIALILMAIHISGSEVTPMGEKVKSATRLGPTVFPILFAAIIGRSLRALAGYQAERGSKLGKLEQMMGSLTISGAFGLQISLRTFDLLGFSLIILWALSPIGGQASLRLLDVGVQSTQVNRTLKYLDSDSLSVFDGDDVFSELGFLTNALYQAAVLTPPDGQAANMDTWGNIKIPVIENLEQSSRANVEGWYPVPVNNTSFSSLVGLPVAGIPVTGSSSFTVESNYMLTSCPSLKNWQDSSLRGVGQGFNVNMTGGTELDESLYPGLKSYPNVEPASINFTAGSLASPEIFNAVCELTRSSVESNITCDGSSCKATHIRRSIFDLRPPGYTALLHSVVGNNFKVDWPTAAGSHHEGTSTSTEYFLSDPTLRNLPDMMSGEGVNLVGIPAEVFSERFAILLNTYYQCGLVPWLRTGNLPVTQTGLNGLNSSLNDETGAFNPTIVSTIYISHVYIYNRTWAAISFATSAVLILCGLCGAILRFRTRGPQILGYVSTMTRDNPYLKLPQGGCTLDGLDRTRLLKDVKVMLQDVAPYEDVGHIALSYADTSNSKRLSANRLYAGHH